MIRLGLIGFAAVASALSIGATRESVPDACVLLTATDAATLAGYAVTQDPDDTGGSCLYHRTGATGVSGDAVEVTVRTYADAATAHAGYPTWVKPFPKPNPHIVLIPLPSLGDEATLVHIIPSPGITGIYFRHGLANVKVGVYPPVSDSALSTAAKTMLSRM